jgi:hypothetical protein
LYINNNETKQQNAIRFSFSNNDTIVTWWTKNAVRKNFRPVLYCRNSAETRQEDANKNLEKKCREFAVQTGLDAEMRQKFQDMIKRIAEDDSCIFVPDIDISRWERPKSKKRRRAKS